MKEYETDPFLCESSHDGAYEWTYVQAQMNNSNTVNKLWKLNNADCDMNRRNQWMDGVRHWCAYDIDRHESYDNLWLDSMIEIHAYDCKENEIKFTGNVMRTESCKRAVLITNRELSRKGLYVLFAEWAKEVMIVHKLIAVSIIK